MRGMFHSTPDEVVQYKRIIYTGAWQELANPAVTTRWRSLARQKNRILRAAWGPDHTSRDQYYRNIYSYSRKRTVLQLIIFCGEKGSSIHYLLMIQRDIGSIGIVR